MASAELLTGTAPARRELPDEPRKGHGALLTGGLAFIPNELSKLKLALGAFAPKAAVGVLARSGCSLEGQAQRACLGTFVVTLVEQGWRRPLAGDEAARFLALLETAGTREGDLAAMEGVLLALFFSPSFLYHTEVGTPEEGRPGVNALSSFEIAARLSFLATQGPPDGPLMAVARADRLRDPGERGRQFDRLVRTPLGKRALAAFMLEWLGAGEAKVAEKSARYLAGLGSDIEAALAASAVAAVEKGVLETPSRSVGALLSTTAYLADPTVAKIRAPAGMGRTASGDSESGVRLGLMMHPHVLAAHTKEDGASPFQLGLFLRENLMCQKVPEPPPGAQAEANTSPPPGLTIREDLEHRTNVGGPCQACHQLFAPLGYAFLPFDPVGRWVLQDPSGKPWALAGRVDTFEAAALPFEGPDDLMRRLAEHPQVHGCFAQGALEWTLGRALVPEDEGVLDEAAAAARRTRGDLIAVLSAVVVSPAFATVVVPR